MIRLENIKSSLNGDVVTNEDLSKVMDTSDEWIVKRTGIKQRHISKNLLMDDVIEHIKGIDASGIDGVIVTSMSNLDLAPTISSQIACEMQLDNCLCFDLNAACSGFVYALIVANGLIVAGTCKRILIVSAEKMSNIIDPQDRGTAILFGDGISSVIVNAGSGILENSYFNTIGPNHSLIKKHDQWLTMEGQKVFKFATNAISDAINNSILKSDYKLEEMDYFLFHQANMRIIRNIVKKYQLDENKVICNIEEVANTSSASIPILLSSLDLKAGDKVFMVGFGAGLAYGSTIYIHQ